MILLLILILILLFIFMTIVTVMTTLVTLIVSSLSRFGENFLRRLCLIVLFMIMVLMYFIIILLIMMAMVCWYVWEALLKTRYARNHNKFQFWNNNKKAEYVPWGRLKVNPPERPASDGGGECHKTCQKEEQSGPANLPTGRVNPRNWQCLHHITMLAMIATIAITIPIIISISKFSNSISGMHLETIRVNFFWLNPVPADWLIFRLIDCPAISFVFVCWPIEIQKVKKFSWAIN